MSLRQRGRRILCPAVLALFLAGCGGGPGPETPSSSQPSSSPPPAAAEQRSQSGVPSLAHAKHKDGVHLAINTDQERYRPGQKVMITVTVSNLGQQVRDYTMWNIGDPRVYVSVDARPHAEKEIPLKPAGRENDPLIPAPSSASLQPGESFVHEVVWDQTIPQGDARRPVPPGRYTIKATLYLGRYTGGGTTSPLEVTRTIEIAG